MGLISLEEAANRLRMRSTTLEQWSERGLLLLHVPGGRAATPRAQRFVEEEELSEVAEKLGWLFLSADNWEGPKDS